MKKYVAAILTLFFMLSSVSVRAEASFTLSLSTNEVQRGGEIVLSGTVASGDNDVVVKIVRPNQTIFYMDSIASAQGAYSAKVTIPTNEDYAPYGEYNVVAGSGGQTASQKFLVVDPNGNGGGTTPGSGGHNHHDSNSTAGGTGTAPTAPAVSTGIPSSAGKVTDATVQPEGSEDGRYIFGSDTLAQAMLQAKGSITIQLPAEAGASGKALEFPAQSLKALKDKSLDLIITSGNNTVRFPAGSISATEHEQSRIRIELSTAWTDEAKNVLNQSLKSHSDYISTGVILSVVIKVVSGDSTVEIHNLDKPAVVSIQLTPEQQKAISSNLAGIYYVSGEHVEYVGGTVNQGIFTFTAPHFSYYTILELNKTFVDLAGHWADPSVRSLTAKHIVEGVDDQHYEPNRGITRAEFVTMVMRALKWRGAATPKAAAHSFSDVPAGEFYTEQVAEAASLGIVSGYNGAFRPNDKITREEAVVALVQAAPYFNIGKSVKDQPAFADMNEISDWAAAAVNKAWAQGLIEGDGAQFHPKLTVTRAEVAAMIHRLLPSGSL